MICFMDQTFCSAYGEYCSNSDCSRALTKNLKEKAEKWWGGKDFPVAFSDFYDGCLYRESMIRENN